METSLNNQSKNQLDIGWKIMAGWGIAYIFFSIIVPITSLLNPTFFAYGLEDAKFVGMSWTEITAMSPNMGLFMVFMMVIMCAMMMGNGILTFEIARKPYRNGELWAWKTLFISNILVLFVYFLPITWLYATKGLYGWYGPSMSAVNIGIPFAIVWIAVIFFGLWLPRKEFK